MERRLLDRLEPSRAQKRPWPRAAIVAAAVVAAAMLALSWARMRPSADEAEPAWVTIAATSRGQEIALPHDGALWVGPHSRVALATSDASGAIVRLHEGELALRVRSGPGLAWRVEVDGFAVEAIGTRFVVTRTGGVPAVVVEEGVVRLTGPDLPQDGIRIAAKDARITEDASEPPPRAEHAGPARDDSARHEIAPTPAVVAHDEPRERAEAARERPRWVGRFRDAIDAGDDVEAVAALPEGFPTGREVLSATDYLDAGDALMSQRQPERAEAAYRAACRRPQAAACGVATFRRALLASRRGDPEQAILLATEYLDEHPGGALAREVLSRRMQWQSVHGSMDAARDDARAYLERWPDGPHVDLARRISE